MYLHQVKGKNVIILDDIIQSGVTVTEMAKLAKAKGTTLTLYLLNSNSHSLGSRSRS